MKFLRINVISVRESLDRAKDFNFRNNPDNHLRVLPKQFIALWNYKIIVHVKCRIKSNTSFKHATLVLYHSLSCFSSANARWSWSQFHISMFKFIFKHNSVYGSNLSANVKRNDEIRDDCHQCDHQHHVTLQECLWKTKPLSTINNRHQMKTNKFT